MIKNEFHLNRNAAQTTHNINDLYGVNTINERTTRCWNASDMEI